jgi:glycosyltransferase involved in cell wall biosynthesis
MVGHCSPIRDFYHSIDVFVQSSDYEGTANVVLEAMATEVPVVATRVGGTQELIAHEVHALLVEPGNAASLCRAIECTVQDANGTRERVQAARSRVETELSFERRCGSLEQLYRQLMCDVAETPFAERNDD